MKILKIMLVFIMITGMTACSGKQAGEDKTKISVAIEPLRYFADRITAGRMDIITMIPQNASPENYEISSQQMIDFSDSAIYFSLDLPAERNSILDVVADGTEVVDLQAAVSMEYPLLKLGNSVDPHIWMSVSRAETILRTMTDEICLLDPANEESYRENSLSLIADLDGLDAYVDDSLSGLGNRYFIVYHPSLQYFADEYDLDMIAIQQEGKEASAGRLTEIIDFARENKIRAVFYQAEIDSSQAESIAAEIGGETVMVNPLAYDYIENFRKMAEVIKGNME